MNDEANDDSDHVHPQLSCHYFQILDGDNLATDQAGNTKGRVPVSKGTSCKVILFSNNDNNTFYL